MDELEPIQPQPPTESKLSTPLSPEMAEALALVAEGHSYRYAARETGLPHTTIWEHGLRCGGPNAFGQETLQAVKKQIAEVRREATAQLSESLRAGDIKPSQLPTTVGILTDKSLRILELEHRRPGGDSTADKLTAALDRMVQAGAKATFTLEPVNPEDRAIDVTPLENHTKAE